METQGLAERRCLGGGRDERERSALRDAAGPKRRATGADRSAGAAPSTVRGGDGLPEA